MKRIFIALLSVFAFCGTAVADDAVERMMAATISIFPAGIDDQAGGGSGVVISPDGYALTNFHVVQPCGPAMRCAMMGGAMADGKLYDAVVVGLDPVGDIALIKLIGREDFSFSTLADSDAVAVGDTAIVMGNPFLLALDFKPCVSKGIISGVHRYQFPSGTFLEYTDCLQTDAAVNPGNSGGPLFNERGEVIGIIGRCSFEKRGRVNVGIGYAVSSNQVRYFLGDLKSGRIVDHATMNAVVSTDKESRVVFDDVLGTSDAYRSGLRYDDQLLRFAGRPVDSANTFKNLLGIFPKGWRLPVTVRGKDAQRYELLVRLGGLHTEAELVEMTEKMIEPPIVPPELKKVIEEQEKLRKKAQNPDSSRLTAEEIPKGYKEIEIPGPDGKPVKVLQKEHFIPEAVKPFYEKQRGYANFYFNRLERDRVLQRWRHSWSVSNGQPWSLSGTLRNRPEPFSFQIDDKGVRFDLPVEKGIWDAGLMKRDEIFVPDPLMHYQAPRGSGGLFTALYLLRQLALFDAARSDMEVVYVGTAPVRGRLDTLFDVCAASWLGNDVRFYFEPREGALAQIEMTGSSLDFPCEILFSQRDGKREFEVRYGRILFGVFEIAETVPKWPFDSTDRSSPTTQTPLPEPSPVLAGALEKVVKIYGAETLSAGGTGMHGYQTGILVSPDGAVLTTLTSALQSDSLAVVLDSGRKYEARLVQADPVTEIALLSIPADGLPFFELDSTPTSPTGRDQSSDLFGFDDRVRIGDPVFAVSNPFNIAQGNEPATVQRGHIAARTSLRARRGVFETPYHGPVLVLDMTTNNPGASGGALISAGSGRLLGLLGKELRNSENNSWFNFAIPAFAFRDKVLDMIARSKKPDEKPLLVAAETIKPETELIPEDTIRVFQDWGLILVPSVGRRTPPFVDSVRPGSKAEELGLQPDDLIVMVDNRLTPSLAAVERQIQQIPDGETVRLTVERRLTLLDVSGFVKKK